MLKMYKIASAGSRSAERRLVGIATHPATLTVMTIVVFVATPGRWRP